MAKITKIPEKPKHKLTEARKTFQQDGHWIIKPRKSVVYVCACGNRYLKTRLQQRACVRCLYAPAR